MHSKLSFDEICRLIKHENAIRRLQQQKLELDCRIESLRNQSREILGRKRGNEMPKVTCKSTNCLWNNALKWNAKGYCTKDEIDLDLKEIKRHDGEWYDYTDCTDYEYACKGESFRKG